MKAQFILACLWVFTWTSGAAQGDEAWTVFNDDGTIEFSTETLRLIADTTYRHETYPEAYLIQQVPDLLDQKRYMLALWTLINVFPDNARQTATVARMLADEGIRGQYYLNAFYTYVFADPQIFHFDQQGVSYMENPILLEKKLENCKTLIAYTEEYRKSMKPGE